VKRVAFVLKRDKPEAVAIASELVPWLVERGHEAYLSTDYAALVPGARTLPEALLTQEADLLVTLGGDGTLLFGAGLIGPRPVPVLGVNLGRLGFLTPFDPEHAKGALERALVGTLPIEERMRLLVRLVPTGDPPIERLALNDAIISQTSIARLIELDARLDGDPITIYRADGLIVCTPTGSTAYNLAAGGPILTPGHSAMAVTPICPHTLTNRPLVVPAEAHVQIALHGVSPGVMLTVDGRWAHPLGLGDRVDISRSTAPLCVFRSDKTYFEILQEKLKWGEREA
jgi:NAD+ kinase